MFQSTVDLLPCSGIKRKPEVPQRAHSLSGYVCVYDVVAKEVASNFHTEPAPEPGLNALGNVYSPLHILSDKASEAPYHFTLPPMNIAHMFCFPDTTERQEARETQREKNIYS